ncbi:hypothetical protein ACGFYE_38080 [Streptomyces zaomyceticus]|uniref:hypothetical protein n=1 Tax=Streptomyces zaomyceticus TaxID=68286 RepID=UPI003719320C
MSEDTDKMEVNGRKLLYDFKKFDWNDASASEMARSSISILDLPGKWGPNIIKTNYKNEDWDVILAGIFGDYRQEAEKAVDDRAKMGAIAKVITKLQIMHPFGDANRRLNVHVILPKLLLDNGFHPTISPDMKHMFQGGAKLEDQVDVLMKSQIGSSS